MAEKLEQPAADKRVAGKKARLQKRLWVPTGTQLPLVETSVRAEEKQLGLTALEKSLYRLTCTVNVRTTPVRDAVLALMKELQAEQSSIYLNMGGEASSLEHYMSIKKTGNRFGIGANGSVPSEIVHKAFEEQIMFFSEPIEKSRNSTLYQFNMVPGDTGFSSYEIQNGNKYVCAVPLFMAENDASEDMAKKLGVLVLKGKALAVIGSESKGNTAIQKAALFVASGARMLSRMIDARFDPTTGLSKKPEFEAQLSVLMRSYLEGGSNFSLAMIDLDHFKRINDEHGHLVGDFVLRAVAQNLSKNMRSITESIEMGRRNSGCDDEVDRCFRVGGEELLVLLPDTNLDQALPISERLRKSIESMVIETEGKRIRLSGSFGVVDADTVIEREREHHSNLESKCMKISREVDIALYEAKGSGRNAVAYPLKRGKEREFTVYLPAK